MNENATYPWMTVSLGGVDGNIYALVAHCCRYMDFADIPREEIDAFRKRVSETKSYADALDAIRATFGEVNGLPDEEG